MPTTLWKPQFVVNPTAGNQLAPVSVGLKNGNILVMWQDDNNTSGPSPNNDIVGQLFDPEGNAIGGAFQVNSAYVNSGETEPQVVALPDGGYVVAYGSSIDAPGIGDFIAIQRYNAAGQSVFNDVILDDGQNTLANWDLAADADGNYTIAFERGRALGNENKQVQAIRWNHDDNGRSFEHDAAQNSADHDYLGGVAIFANGSLITISSEFDDFYGPEFKIINPETGATIVGPTNFAPSHSGADVYSLGLDVATLRGGQFVLLYHRFEYDGVSSNDGLAIRIGSAGSPGLSLTDEHIVAAKASQSPHEAQVVALNDGGFMVVWSDQFQDRIFGQSFNASGSRVGETLPIAFGTSGTINNPQTLGSVSLTGDGRVLVSYRTDHGEMALVIVDPRDPVIYGTNGDDVITTRLEKGQLHGLDGQDILLGQGGPDELFGGSGSDLLDGGAGDDDLYGGVGQDTLRGAEGSDTYFLDTLHLVQGGGFFFQAYDDVQEGFTAGTDIVRVRYVDVFGAPTGYTLTSNIEDGVVEGTAAFDLTGNGSGNRLTGNGAANRLEGLGGPDLLAGGLGADTLVGGHGDDDYVLDNLHTVLTGGGVPRNRYDDVIEAVGGGVDRVFVRRLQGENGVFATTYTLTANIEGGVIQGTADFDLVGNELGNSLTGNAAVNRLDGLDGHDILNGGAGGDILAGGLGDDIYHVDNLGDVVTEARGQGSDTVFSSVNFNAQTRGTSVEIIFLTGTARTAVGDVFSNFLVGNASQNVLNGYKGADAMEGRGGNDIYTVDNVGDFVIEEAGGGIDTVNSSIDYVLGATLENLFLLGGGDIDATGNDGLNTIRGARGDNVITGRGGIDVLTGGGGADRFVYETLSDTAYATYDRIKDLSADDVIDLRGIDADTGTAGDQAFALVDNFSGQAGEMTLTYVVASRYTVLAGDVNGDGVADMRIVLTGNHVNFAGIWE